MSVDITAIGLGVDTSKLKAGTRDLDAFGASAGKAADKADDFSKSTQSASKASSGLSAATGVATTSLIGLVGSFAVLNSLKGITGAVDNYVKYTAQLKLATKSQDDYNTALSSVNRIANTAQANVSAIATLYARLSNSLQDAGVSQQQLANVTETVALSLKVTGASASETASTMLQLSQAFGSGVLRGDEFNSIAENAPALLRALADSMGVTVGALRGLAHDGQLTSEVLLKAFSDPELVKKLQEQAKEVNTLSGAFETLKNEGGSAIGSLVKDSGLLDLMTSSVLLLRDALVSLKNVAGSVTPIQTAGLVAGLPAPFQAAIAAAKVIALGRKAGTATSGGGATSGTVGGAGAITGGASPYPNFNGTVVAEDINKIHQQQEEALRIKTEAIKKYDAIRKKSNDEALKDIQDSIDEETEMLDAKNSFELKSIKAIEKQKEEAYKAELKRLDELQDVANKNFKAAQDAFAKEQEEYRKEFEKTVDSINNIFREGFANLVNGGKGTWKSFTKSLFTTFKTAVADQIYKLFAQPFVVQLVAAISGVGVSGAANAASSLVGGSSSSGGGGFLGAGKSVLDAIKGGNASIVGGIENLGAIIANGNGGLLDSIGGFMGQNAGLIADILPYTGAVLSLLKGDIKGGIMQGIGVAIGSYFGGPIGGAIGGAIGSWVGGLIGGNDKGHRSGATVSTNYSNGALTNIASNKGTATKFNPAYVAPLTALSDQFAKELGGLLTNFGEVASFGLSSEFKAKQKGGKGNTKAAFSGNVGGVSFARTFDFEQKDTEAFQKYVNLVLGETLVQAIQSSTLSAGVKKFFNGLTNKEDVLNTINTLTTLKNSLNDLPPVFKAIKSAIDNAEIQMNATQLQQSFNNIGTYTSLFYSQTENFATFTKQLNSTFSGLNITLPETREGFRALIDGIDTTTTSGLGLFNALVSLAPTVDGYYKALQAQSDATKEATDNAYALADALNTNNFKNVVDFTRAQRYQENGIPLSLLPSYDVGTSYVPNDGPAMLHQGEAVLTRAENAARSSGGNGEIKGLLVDLIQEIRRTSLPQIQAVQKIAKILDRIDEDGIVISETDRSGERVTLDTRVVA